MCAMQECQIAIADSQYLTRVGLREVVGKSSHLHIAGEASDEKALLALLEQKPVDIIILDHNQPGKFSMQTLTRLQERSPSPDVLIISADNDKGRIFKVLEAGASSYLTKECDEAEILDAIRATSRGDKFFCTKILDYLLEKSFGKSFESKDACGPSPLTPREVEVVRLIAAGMVAKEIAGELHLSTHTIYTHRKNIMRKLELANSSELVRYAIDRGWVD